MRFGSSRTPAARTDRSRRWAHHRGRLLADNIDLDAAIASNNTVIAAYATRADRPSIPFWRILFNNVTIRWFGSDDFPIEITRQAAADLSTVAARLALRIGDPLPLAAAAQAHDRLDAGSRDRSLLSVGIDSRHSG